MLLDIPMIILNVTVVSLISNLVVTFSGILKIHLTKDTEKC